MTPLPQQFLDQMRALLPGDEYNRFVEAMAEPPRVSIRRNLHKSRGFASGPEQVPWCPLGAYLDEREAFTFHPQFHGGAFYVQDASSMIIHAAIKSLALDSPVRYLDLCAAPGGKTTAIAERMNNTGRIIASDIYRRKLDLIDKEARRLGITNIETSWEKYIGIQYTDRGEVYGIDGYVDRDLFGTEIFLEETSEIPSYNDTSTYNTETVYYIVKRGNTLSEIAQMYGTTVQEIVNINDIQNPNLIYPGERFRILTNSTIAGNEERGLGDIIYTVRRGDTLSKIARSYNVTVHHIVELNNIQNPNLIFPMEKLRITESNLTELKPLN